jgi:hypothetical protein
MRLSGLYSASLRQYDAPSFLNTSVLLSKSYTQVNEPPGIRLSLNEVPGLITGVAGQENHQAVVHALNDSANPTC